MLLTIIIIFFCVRYRVTTFIFILNAINLITKEKKLNGIITKVQINLSEISFSNFDILEIKTIFLPI